MNERKQPLRPTPLVIEFVGPPGAGKTTSCHYFAEELKRKGLQVCLLDDLENYIQRITFGNKLILILESCFTKGHIISVYILTLLFKRIFELDSYTRYLSLIIREKALKQLLKEKSIDIVLLDQWSIQALWSSTIFHLKPSQRFEKHLTIFHLKVDILLYFAVPPSTAASRMQQRLTFRSRFDEMDIITRNKALNKYNSYLIRLFRNANCKNKRVFSTMQTPEENLKEFMSTISSFQGKNSIYTHVNKSSKPNTVV